jgi:hypothetical protein
MTHGKLWIGAVVLVAGLAGACGSKSTPSQTGAAGSGGAGSGGAGSGAAGTGAGKTPTELVNVVGCGNLRLVLVGSTIYYTNKTAGTVSSVAVAGGAPKVIAMGQSKPNPIVADATNVYWGNDGDAIVYKQALSGGAAAPILPAPAAADPKNVANALLVSGPTLYVGRGVDTYKVPVAGGTPTQLSHSPDLDMGYPGAFALDAGEVHLYQTEMQHNAISRETTDGKQDGLLETGTAQMLAPDRLAVSRAGLVTDAIAVSGQHVLWANLANIEAQDKDMPEAAGGTYSVIATSDGFNALSGFVLSGNTIYFGETTANNVQSVPLNFNPDPNTGPQPSTVIATGLTNPAEFAADDANIYFTTITATDASGTCKILKLAK